MKKFITILLSIAMIVSVASTMAMTASAYDEPAYPELVITEIEFNPTGTDYYDCIEIMNTTNEEINLYEYAIGYNGSGHSKAAYETQLTETTPIRGGSDWLDVGAELTTPYTSTLTNPESGILGPKEVALLWCIDSNSYDTTTFATNKTVDDFRNFYGISEDVKVFCFDSNTGSTTTGLPGSDKNFSVKNTATGTYSIVKYSDDLDAKTNVKGKTYNTPNGYMEEACVISWAVVNCDGGVSKEVMDANGGAGSDTKTLAYVWNEENQKRMVPVSYVEETFGALSPEQLAIYNPAKNADKELVSVTSGGNTTNYKTVAEAVAALNDGDTLTLLDDVVLADSINITKSVTVDGNGKQIINHTSASAISVSGAGITVTVKDAKIISYGNGITVAACADEASRSTINVQNCDIDTKDAGINLDQYWNVNISDCDVDADNRGIYFAGDGFNTVKIENCTVDAMSDYGMYFRSNSTVTVSNTSVTSNRQSAIQIITSAKDTGTTLTLNNATVNSAEAYAVAVNPNNSVYINGGTYKTTGADAAVNVVGYGAYAKITDGYFECDKNCAIRVYWSNDTYADCGIPVLDIYGGTFVYTATDDDGSALRAGTSGAWGIANIYGGTFKTYGAGPVVNYVRAEGVINIAGGTYENCGTYDIKVATQRYGGVDVTDRDYVFPAGAKLAVWQDGALVDPNAQPDTTTTEEVTTSPIGPDDTDAPSSEIPDDTDAPSSENPEVTSAPDEPDTPIVGDNIGTIIIIIAISLVAIASTVAFVVIKKKEN